LEDKLRVGLIGNWITNKNTLEYLSVPDYFEFRADGTYRADLVTGLVTGRWEINGNKLLLTGASKFELSEDGFDILKRTGNEFEFTDTYYPEFEAPNSWEDHQYKGAKAEITYYLQKK